MSRILALELNDTGLRVAGDPSLIDLEPSPGWAVFEPHGSSILVGPEAAERIRLHPRLAHRRIWSELDLTPLPRPFPRGLSTADLAYAQLRSIWERAEVALGRAGDETDGRLLVAPGSFTVEQLGLVLGISDSLGSPFSGVVDSAVAAASTLATRSSVVLDLELGRAVATRIELSDSGNERRIVRGRVRSQQGVGWNDLIDSWARAVGRSFVKTTRFDPLHAARSEQELYTTLPGWLAELTERESAEAWMRGGDREHRIVLTRQEIAAAAEPLYARIVELARSLGEPNGEALIVSDRLRGAPGLIERLVSAGLPEPTVLGPGAALEGALRYADRLHRPAEAAPRWVTELPLGTPPAAAESPSAAGTVG